MGTAKGAAKRFLSSYLQVRDNVVQLQEGEPETIEVENESPAYPGLQTLYRKFIIDAEIVSPDPKVLDGLRLPKHADFTKRSVMADVRTWSWRTVEQCRAENIVVGGEGAA